MPRKSESGGIIMTMKRPLSNAERQARVRERSALRERLAREKLDEIQTAENLEQAQALAAEVSVLMF